jgi:hypothetical protein
LIGGAGGAASSVVNIVLFRRLGGAAAAAAGGGTAGTCNRCPQAGQGFLVPASIEGASNGALQRGQLYLIAGVVSPSMVLWKAGAGPDAWFLANRGSGTDAPAMKGDLQLGQTWRLPISPSGIDNLNWQAGQEI